LIGSGEVKNFNVFAVKFDKVDLAT